MKRVKTPTVLQMEATECGAAVLGMVLGYYKRYIPLGMLRNDCGVSRDGSKAVNILKAARQHNMQANAAKVEDLDALKKITLPFIVFWGFNHFVVVEGIKANKFYINDPATGPRTVSRQAFNELFTGLVLICTPNEDFKQQGSPPSLLSPLKKRLQGSLIALFFVVLSTLALTIPGLLIAGFAKVFIDYILIAQIKNWLMPLLAGLLLTACLRGLLTWLQQTYLLRLHLKVKLTQTAHFFWHILHLPVAFFQQRYAGDISDRIESNNRIAQLLSNQLATSLVSLLSMVLYALVLLALNWQLAVVVILITSINSLIFYLLTHKIADQSRVLLQQSGQLAGFEVNGLRFIETLKASALEQVFFSRWAGMHAKTINSQQHIQYYTSILELVPSLLSGLTTITVLGLGSVLILQGEFTIGALIAFQSLMASFQEPINTLLGMGQQTQQIRADLMRLEDALKYPADASFSINNPAERMHDKKQSHLSLHNISFGYSPLEAPLLKNFSLDLAAGKRIALIGTTGSGKSTIAKLICRFYPPWSGEIKLNNKPLNQVHPSELACSMAFVDQGIFLFSGTVRENLTLWDTNNSNENLDLALQDACLNEVIANRGGLDSFVTEGGSNFSGGECQRLEIARALSSNPSLIIFDEATSALDAIVEQKIYQNIKHRQCTLLIIAHRLSAIKDCDEILVLEQGSIVQRGHHQQLIEQPGPYHQLISLET